MNRVLAIFGFAGILSAQEVNPDRRLDHATQALRAFLSVDSNVPKDLAGKAQCIIVVPRLMKGAGLVGGKYGRGFASCRRVNGGWSSPAAIAMESSNLDSATDLILVVVNPAGMQMLLDDKFTVDADVVSFSRNKELFNGASLAGATLRTDAGENKKLYGYEIGNADILSGKERPPRGARAFVAELNKRARKGK
ncbi:MAG: lipid-binding SYLF domain-containing protein [Bryobacteraceae bacterium]